jgi:hypothetical protein
MKAWKRYGAWIIVCLQLITGEFHLYVAFGIVLGLMITVPCGIAIINKTMWLWYLRQAFFLLGGLAFCFCKH